MIADLTFKIAIAFLYILDLLAMGPPILVWLLLGVYAGFSTTLFFWGWLVIMIITATVWLRLLARIRNHLWVTLIEREPNHLGDRGE